MGKRKRSINKKSVNNQLPVTKPPVKKELDLSDVVKKELDVSDDVKKEFDLSNDAKKELDFDKIDQIGDYSQASCSHAAPFSKLDSSVNSVADIMSVINKVRNLQILPSIHIYSISPKGQGISAVDVNENLSHIAYAVSHSCEIRLLARNDLSINITGNNICDAALKYATAKNQLLMKKKRGLTESLSSPQMYFIGHDAEVTGLRFTIDSNLLLSCYLDGSTKVISTATHRVLEQYNNGGFSSDIDVNSGCTNFVTAGAIYHDSYRENAIFVYDFQSKNPISTFLGHQDVIKCVRFHSNGLYLATAASDKTVKLWSIRDSKLVRNFQDGVDDPEKLTFSPDGKYLAATYNTCVKIWDLASGKMLKHLETPNSKHSFLNVCYNSTGNMLAAGGLDGNIHLWNIKSTASTEVEPEFDLVKSETVDGRIFSIKYVANFFSCVTG